MTVQIEIDDATLAEVDAALKILNENREEAAVAGQYADAYRKPVGDEEFSIEDEQLIEVWDEL